MIRIITLLLLLQYPAAQAQPDNDKYKHLLLFGQFGEFCTMCEAVLLCRGADAVPQEEGVPGEGSFTLYHLQTRTFWSQIATIREWFVANFQEEPVSGHHRPVWVYEVRGPAWAGPQIDEMHVDVEPALLTMGDTVIDRSSSQWLRNGAPRGYCQRMPLWDAIETIEARTGVSS